MSDMMASPAELTLAYLGGGPVTQEIYTTSRVGERLVDFPNSNVLLVFSWRRDLKDTQAGFDELAKYANSHRADLTKQRDVVLYGENRDSSGAVTVFVLTPRLPKIFESQLRLGTVDESARLTRYLEIVAAENKLMETESQASTEFEKRWATPRAYTLEPGRRPKLAVGYNPINRTLGFYVQEFEERERGGEKVYAIVRVQPLEDDGVLRTITPVDVDVRAQTLEIVKKAVEEGKQALDKYRAQTDERIEEKLGEVDKRVKVVEKFEGRLKDAEATLEKHAEADKTAADAIASLETKGQEIEDRVARVEKDAETAHARLKELVGVQAEFAILDAKVRLELGDAKRVEARLNELGPQLKTVERAAIDVDTLRKTVERVEEQVKALNIEEVTRTLESTREEIGAELGKVNSKMRNVEIKNNILSGAFDSFAEHIGRVPERVGDLPKYFKDFGTALKKKLHPSEGADENVPDIGGRGSMPLDQTHGVPLAGPAGEINRRGKIR